MEGPGDELAQLIQALNPGGTEGNMRVSIPQNAVLRRNWDRVVIAKVLTDRTTFTNQFSSLMRRVWGVDPGTQITMIATNTFLVDFVSVEEMKGVLKRDPWVYRQDMIAMRRANCQAEVSAGHVSHIEIWTQLHNVPTEVVSNEGIAIMVEKLGPQLSDVQRFDISGRMYLRVKVLYPIDKKLEDTIYMDLPNDVTVQVFPVYEKLGRVCMCCGQMGHEISGCDTYERILQLASDPIYSNRPEMIQLKEKRKGPWIVSAGLVPRSQDLQTGPGVGSAQYAGQQEGGPQQFSPQGHASNIYGPQHPITTDGGEGQDQGLGQFQGNDNFDQRPGGLSDLVISDQNNRREVSRRLRAATHHERGNAGRRGIGAGEHEDRDDVLVTYEGENHASTPAKRPRAASRISSPPGP